MGRSRPLPRSNTDWGARYGVNQSSRSHGRRAHTIWHTHQNLGTAPTAISKRIRARATPSSGSSPTVESLVQLKICPTRLPSRRRPRDPHLVVCLPARNSAGARPSTARIPSMTTRCGVGNAGALPGSQRPRMDWNAVSGFIRILLNKKNFVSLATRTAFASTGGYPLTL